MKIFQIILITTLVICIHNTCMKLKDVASKTECFSRELSDAEKASEGKYCCYFLYLDGSHEDDSCLPFSQKQIDNIEDTIKAYETLMEVTVKSLDCKSSYLQIGLLGLLFFLF